MLAILHKAFVHPPQELNSSTVGGTCMAPKHPEEIFKAFHAAHPDNSFSATFSGGAVLASVVSAGRHFSAHRRLFCIFDDICCLFSGSLDNLSSLIKQYGLCKATDKALLVIEAYRMLRDRGPYPADQVVKDLNGSFVFVVYDNKSGTIFAVLVAASTNRPHGSPLLLDCPCGSSPLWTTQPLHVQRHDQGLRLRRRRRPLLARFPPLLLQDAAPAVDYFCKMIQEKLEITFTVVQPACSHQEVDGAGIWRLEPDA